MKTDYYNCFSIVTTLRTIDLQVNHHKKLLTALASVSYLIQSNEESLVPNEFYDRKVFSFQRIRMILAEICMEKNLTLNELFLIGLIRLAKQQSDQSKYFFLLNILSRRFDTAF